MHHYSIGHFFRLRKLRSGAAGLGTAAVLLMSLAVPAPLVDATSTTPAPIQLGGADRAGTAAIIAEHQYPSGVTTAIITSGADANLVDAVTVAPLAKALGAPILLASSPTVLGTETAQALTTLHVQKVILVGAAGQISASQLPSGVSVSQTLEGPTRYQTAQLIAQALANATGSKTFSEAFVVSGDNAHLIDGLAIGPVAAENKAPILLAPDGGTSLPDGQAAYVAPGATVYGIGAASTDSLALTATWKPVAGADRYATAIAIDQQFSRGQAYPAVAITNGTDGHWVDALTGAPFLASVHAALVLVNPADGTLPSEDSAFLGQQTQPGVSVYILGGTVAVPDVVKSQVLSMVATSLSIVPGPGPYFVNKYIPLELSSSNSNGSTALQGTITWKVASGPGGATLTPDGTQATVMASQPGSYVVTAQDGALSASVTLTVTEPALAPSQVYFYAGNSLDQQSAATVAQQLGIPTSNVITDYTTAWNLVAGGSQLVIAVGSPAVNNLSYAACGVSNPGNIPGGQSTPFAAFPTGQGVDQLSAGKFVNASGITAQNSETLATMLATYALTGAYPSGSGALPAQEAPTQTVCSSTGSSTMLGGFDTDKSLAGVANSVGTGTPYAFVLRYLGGPCYPVSSDPLSSAEAVALSNTGAKLSTIYSGANDVPGEAVCGTQTLAQGQSDARAAVSLAEGVQQPAHTVIYLDVESKQSGTGWLSYVQGWASTIAALGYVPGVYSTPGQLSTIYNASWGGSAIQYWAARWWYTAQQTPLPNPTTIDPHATLWQYTGNVNGPGNIGIDLDSAVGSTGMWSE